MKKLLEHILKLIVEHPDDISVEESEQEGLANLLIKANPEDIKIIIGKEGRTIKAIREIVRLKALASQRRINIRIEEEA